MSTEATKVINLRDRVGHPVAPQEVDAMKAIMVAVREAEASSPGAKVDDLVNDLVEFMLTLTQADCNEFARSIRQVMDSVVDARSTHKDEYLSTFANKKTEELTDHQKLVRELQRSRAILEGSVLQNDISVALQSAGFNPRVPVASTPLVVETVEEEEHLSQTVSEEISLEERMTLLEETVVAELQYIKNILDHTLKNR